MSDALEWLTQKETNTLISDIAITKKKKIMILECLLKVRIPRINNLIPEYSLSNELLQKNKIPIYRGCQIYST